jgi:FkbM family methyltransferase
MLSRILKPHYVWRPRQAGRRLLQALFDSPSGAVTVTLPWGLPLQVDTTGTGVGPSLWRLGLYDLAVSETLWRLLDPGDLAVDAGANIGYMTSIMATRTGPAGRVLAFEPHPEVRRRLSANVARFGSRPGMSPVEVSAAALGERTGPCYLDPGDDFAHNQGTARVTDRESAIPIEMTTLDRVLGPDSAALVKIDVEGAEPQVLAGAAGALCAGRIRDIVYEAYAEHRQRLHDFLAPRGYQVFGLGWNLRGLILSPPCDPPRLPPFEAPSFLATRDPDRALLRLRPAGWRILRP